MAKLANCAVEHYHVSCHVFRVQRPSDAPMSQLTGPQGPKEIRSEKSGRGNGFSSRQVKLIRGPG